MAMSKEIEEQQQLTYELKEQLRSLEADSMRTTEQIKILEAKLVVQEFRDKVRVKKEEINQLQARKQELEEKLKSPEKTPAPEEQMQFTPSQEEPPRTHF